MSIWVISEQKDLVLELASKARELAQGELSQVVAVVNSGEIAQKAIKVGADKAYVLPNVQSLPWEAWAESLAGLIKKNGPRLILVGATRRGKDLAGRLAALLDLGCASDCQEISFKESKFTFERYTYGGLAKATLESQEPMVLATVPARTFPVAEAQERAGEITTLGEELQSKWQIVEVRPKGKDSVNIKEAKVVVGVGRGWAKEEDLQQAFALAQALGGEVGCTRPVAEDLHWLPEERYIGISGQVIKPSLYLALGLSGQVQHTSGIRDAKVVIAVNTNENAPIFQAADYCLVGDIYKIVPALLQELKK